MGRATELDALRSAYSRAGVVPTAVIIAGEAGIGKSRLVREFTSLLAPDRVVTGSCLELAGDPIVFAAVEDALRQLPEASEVVAVEGAVVEEPPIGSIRRLEQFERWARRLGEADARRPPKVLIVEDLHWADESTLDFLAYLVRSLRRFRLMVVMTWRNDEEPASGARTTVAEMIRLPCVTCWTLSRLSRDQAAELLAGVRAPNVEQLYRLSEGNPYLLAEVATAGGRVPTHVRDVLIDRVRRLPKDGQSLGRLAAVIGTVVNDELLWTASALAAEQHLTALESLIEGGVLRVVGDGYEFRHSLTREAILSELLPFELRRLHGQVAAGLEASGAVLDAAAAAAIAAHWNASGERDRTLDASLAAARLAYDANAFTESWRHYQRVLVCAEVLKDRPLPASVLIAAAEAARWAGDAAAGVDLLRRAQGQVDEVTERATLHERIGRYLWDAGQPGSHDEYLAATELLATLPASPVQASVLAAQARASVLTTNYGQATSEATAAMNDARRWGLKTVEADSLNSLALARVGVGDPTTGVTLLRQALAIAEMAGDFEILCRTYGNLTFALERAGDYEGSVGVALSGLAALRERGLQLGVRATLANNAASILILRGRYGEGEKLLAELLAECAEPSQLFQLHITLAELRLRQGNLEGARDSLTAATELGTGGDPMSAVFVAMVDAEVRLLEEDAGGARTVIFDALVTLQDSIDDTVRMELCRLGMRVVADLNRPRAEAREATGGDDVSWLVDRLPSPQDPDRPSAIELAFAAERARAGHDEDWETWDRAAGAWEAAAQPWEVAYCRLRQAEHAASRRQSRRAQTALAASWTAATHLGAQPLVDLANDLARRARLTIAAPSPPAPRVALPLGLTPRESEVLGLIAEGATNAEIASALFIGERTAAVHVSSILRKLGVVNRIQAATRAKGLGVVRTTQAT